MNTPSYLVSIACLVAWTLPTAALSAQKTHNISLVAKPGTAQIEPGKTVKVDIRLSADDRVK